MLVSDRAWATGGQRAAEPARRAFADVAGGPTFIIPVETPSSAPLTASLQRSIFIGIGVSLGTTFALRLIDRIFGKG